VSTAACRTRIGDRAQNALSAASAEDEGMNAKRFKSLRALDLVSLVGLSEGTAQRTVEAAGGTLFCIYDEHAFLTEEYRPNRVTAWVEVDRVRRIFGIG